jgi:hypothetical protein
VSPGRAESCFSRQTTSTFNIQALSIIIIKMAERVAPNDRTPLLGDTDAPADGADQEPLFVRAKRWLYRNLITISLIIPIIVLLALVISLAIKNRHHHSGSSPSPSPSPQPGHGHNHTDKTPVCTSPQCVLAAATLLKSISKRHRDLDACDDFRTFSCEGFDEINEIPSDQTNVGSLKLMSDDGQLILKHILEVCSFIMSTSRHRKGRYYSFLLPKSILWSGLLAYMNIVTDIA